MAAALPFIGAAVGIGGAVSSRNSQKKANQQAQAANDQNQANFERYTAPLLQAQRDQWDSGAGARAGAKTAAETMFSGGSTDSLPSFLQVPRGAEGVNLAAVPDQMDAANPFSPSVKAGLTYLSNSNTATLAKQTADRVKSNLTRRGLTGSGITSSADEESQASLGNMVRAQTAAEKARLAVMENEAGIGIRSENAGLRSETNRNALTLDQLSTARRGEAGTNYLNMLQIANAQPPAPGYANYSGMYSNMAANYTGQAGQAGSAYQSSMTDLSGWLSTWANGGLKKKQPVAAS